MLAQKLRLVRTQKKITQDEVAQFLKVKRQTYSAYERGVSVPDSLTLKKLADYFDVPTDYFFSLEPTVSGGLDAKLQMLSRRVQRIPEAQRERILKNFEENIDIYLEAMGVDKENGK